MPEFKNSLNDFQVKLKNPAGFSLIHLAEIKMYVWDLELKILRNYTNTPYITSDNPLIKYNSFLERKGVKNGITGFSIKGLQLILPISPDTCLLLYDKDVYRVGDRKQKIINVLNVSFVDQVNLLQFLNCDQNVFSNECVSNNYFKMLHTRSLKYQKVDKENIQEYVSLGNFSSVEQRSVLHLTSSDLRIKLNLPFIKETKKAKKYDLGIKLVHTRKWHDKIAPIVSSGLMEQ